MGAEPGRGLARWAQRVPLGNATHVPTETGEGLQHRPQELEPFAVDIATGDLVSLDETVYGPHPLGDGVDICTPAAAYLTS